MEFRKEADFRELKFYSLFSVREILGKTSAWQGERLNAPV